MLLQHRGLRRWFRNVASSFAVATGTGAYQVVGRFHQLVPSDAHPSHHDRSLFGRQRKQRTLLAQTTRRQHLIDDLLSAPGEGRPEDCARGQGSRDYWVTDHQVRRLDGDSAALRVGAVAQLQDVRNEKEGCRQGGGEAGHFARGGQDGRWAGFLAIAGGRVEDGARHQEV